MAQTPFNDVPKVKFLNNMAAPSAGLFGFLYFVVGVIANSSSFQEARGPAAVIPFWEASSNLYHEFFAKLLSVPDVCWMGNTVNDFQVSQCGQFWSAFVKTGGLALFPLAVIGGVLWLMLDNVTLLYKKTQKRIESGKATLTGTVTNPPQAPRDLFSWFYCLTPIMVQLPNRSQLKIYVPSGASTPRPGDTLVAFDMGNARHLGMIYAPHVAVVRGG